jgi:hypothetical protein
MNENDKMTDRDMQRILVETLKVSRENREMLFAISNRQKQSRVFSAIKWILGIAVLIAIYYFLAPHIAEIKNLFSTIESQVSTLTGIVK